MNQHRDTERLLDAWMNDGPTVAPDRVLNVVVDRIERQGQRPAWRLDWRRTTMNPTFKIAAAIGAVVIMALIGYNLLPGSTGFGGPGPSASPEPTVSGAPPVTPTPSLDQDGACGGALSTCRGILTAGTYTSRAFAPALTFTVPSGWYNRSDATRGYGLEPQANQNQSIELLRDLVIARADCVEEAEAGVGTTASAMVQALAARPGLETTQPAPIAVGGLSGFTIDITLATDWTTPCPFSEGRPTVPLVMDGEADPGTALHWTADRVTDGSFARYIILDLPGGGTVLIAPSGPPSFVTQATPIIESFEFAS